MKIFKFFDILINIGVGGIKIPRITKGQAIEETNTNVLPTLQGDFKEWRNCHRIKIPKKVTEDLAENVGMHISDGNMYSGGYTKEIIYCGHAIDDFPYFNFRFFPL